METVLEVLKNTPFWVFLLLIFLLLIGYKALHPRQVSARRLFLLPLIFTLLSLGWLDERVRGHHSLILFWLIGVAIGGLIGWITVQRWNVKIVGRTAVLPPTRSTLILILLAFSSRYFFMYNYEIHPEMASRLFFWDALISGSITGVFIGRGLHLFAKFRKAD